MKRLLTSSLVGLLAFHSLAQTQPTPNTQPAQPNQPNQPTRPAQPGQQDVDRKHEKPATRDQAAEPTSSHRNLDRFVGTWHVTGQAWKDAAGQPESISGICNAEWVLGRRFVKSHAEGTVGSRPLEGFGVCGYDAGERKYTEMWIDNLSTGTKSLKGDYDPATQTFTYTGEFKDEKGQAVKCRKVVKVTSETEHTATSYATVGGKQEMKVMEMTFKRTTSKSPADKNRETSDEDLKKRETAPKK